MNGSSDKHARAARIVDDIRHDPALSHEGGHGPRAAGTIEIVISNLLRAGVIGSLSVIVFGAVLAFVRHRDAARDPVRLPPLIAPEMHYPRSLRAVLDGVVRFDAGAIVVAGLLLLIVTPVLRVAVSIVAFAVQRDTKFVVITCTVLALLILSFVLGHIHG